MGIGLEADAQPAFSVDSGDNVRMPHYLPCLLLPAVNTAAAGPRTGHVPILPCLGHYELISPECFVKHLMLVKPRFVRKEGRFQMGEIN